jgi:hypothetical protein
LPADMGDQCLWHGITTAMWALRYSITGEEEIRKHLHDAIQGFFRLQRPKDLKSAAWEKRRLIRGVDELGNEADNVSNDQASGFLIGVYFLWKHGDLDCINAAKHLIAGLADELAIYDNKLVLADGSPTKHGKLENGYWTDPLNLSLCLAIYKVAHVLTGEQLYGERYKRLVETYKPLIPYAKVKLLWWDEQPAAHRAAIHYSILCDLEKDEDLRKKYLRGLLRTWRIVRKGANPWVYYLVRRVCSYDIEYEERVKKHLKEFTLEDKQYNVQRINSDSVETFKWGDNVCSRQPVPRWRAPSQDFFWQRHLHTVDGWVGNASGSLRHNGLDFLAPYWGLRSIGIIGEKE